MFAPFWSENGYRLYLFWSESREFGNARPYLSFEFEMNKKERVIGRFEIACVQTSPISFVARVEQRK